MAPAETWIFFSSKKKKKKATWIFELVIKVNRSSTQKTSTSTGVDYKWLQGDITVTDKKKKKKNHWRKTLIKNDYESTIWRPTIHIVFYFIYPYSLNNSIRNRDFQVQNIIYRDSENQSSVHIIKCKKRFILELGNHLAWEKFMFLLLKSLPLPNT
jgi:hypothetical protein